MLMNTAPYLDHVNKVATIVCEYAEENSITPQDMLKVIVGATTLLRISMSCPIHDRKLPNKE